MKTLVLWGLVVVAVSLTLVAVMWLVCYYRGLRPTLVAVVPVEKCVDVQFTDRGFAQGSKVIEICRVNGATNGPFFACRGKKVVRFVPERFHGVYGDMEVADADPNMVYFYQYQKRYEVLVWHP